MIYALRKYLTTLFHFMPWKGYIGNRIDGGSQLYGGY